MSEEDEDNDETPEIEFELQLEFYMEGRLEPIFSMMEMCVPARMVRELGIVSLMEACLDDFMAEINQKTNEYVIMRAESGMRQIFWTNKIQAISFLSPDVERIENLVDKALANE